MDGGPTGGPKDTVADWPSGEAVTLSRYDLHSPTCRDLNVPLTIDCICIGARTQFHISEIIPRSNLLRFRKTFASPPVMIMLTPSSCANAL